MSDITSFRHFTWYHRLSCLPLLSSPGRHCPSYSLPPLLVPVTCQTVSSEQWAVSSVRQWAVSSQHKTMRKIKFLFPVFWIDFLIIALAQLVLGINFAKTLNHCIQSWLLYQYSRNHLGNLSDIRCYQGSGIIRQAGHRFPPVKTETWILASIGHHK